VTVVPAFVVGTLLVFFSTKGRLPHRILGAIYLTLMTVTAVDTFFIRSLDSGHLSLIHLFIPLTLFSVVGALRSVQRGNIRSHCYAMIGLYVGGFLLAGALTFLPGRLMHRIFFS
jgi:uncharacterized membrane protein